MNKHWTITPITITLIVIVSILSILQPTPVNAANTQPATAAHVRLLVKQQPDSIFAAALVKELRSEAPAIKVSTQPPASTHAHALGERRRHHNT